MSLLGLDLGTSGCKAAVFSSDGRMLALAYREYDTLRPEPDWAELDAVEVWKKVKETVREVAPAAQRDPVKAAAVSSMGEAMVSVTKDRQILGPSLLNFDGRGAEYLARLAQVVDDETLYRINGNTLGNQYSLTKLMWLRDKRPELYEQTDKFLHWSGFVSFMLGGEALVDYSLANRTLLFDVDRATWSESLIAKTGLDKEKLPPTVPSGKVIGKVDKTLAAELGLNGGIAIVSGAHDQCCNGVGCGVTQEGQAMFGMGTYLTAMPVFSVRQPPEKMIPYGVNTEHHAAPDLFVSFLYVHSGSMFKWFRDTFAAAEHKQAQVSGRSVYPDLIAEMPPGPSRVLVLPHFAQTGPPKFIADSSGVMVGLHLGTTRGEICKAILESPVLYLRDLFEPLEKTGIPISSFRAVGGGSRADAWIQLSADILGKPLTRPAVTEAGALGAAILAGAAVGEFGSIPDGSLAMIKLDKSFEPDKAMHARYEERYALYKHLSPLLLDYLRQVG